MKRILRNLAAVVSIATMMFTTSCNKQEEELSLSEPKLTIDQNDLKFEELVELQFHLMHMEDNYNHMLIHNSKQSNYTYHQLL